MAEEKVDELATEAGKDDDNTEFINYKQLPDEIVISGFSGRLPECSTIQQFKENLFNGIDMVTDDPRRWPNDVHDLPQRLGKIKDHDLESFDCQFFGINENQAECMDPQLRMILESTYEAIVDAGLNPQELRGSRTGVYIGISKSDDIDDTFANHLLAVFDFKGPSHKVDRSWSSSLYAMAQAFTDMKDDRCDAAIVVGSNLILKPDASMQLKRLGKFSIQFLVFYVFFFNVFSIFSSKAC